MNRLQEFMVRYEPEKDTSDVPTTIRRETPVRSLVKVRFINRGMHLSYYNDRFDLQEGDVVYVSGQLAGEPGVVTSVTTKFRIHTADYQRVLALLDLTVRGAFSRMGDKMVSLDADALPPEQFESWVMPPEDPKKKKQREKNGEDEDEVISGEGYAIDIHHIGDCKDISPAVGERGIDYCEAGCVRYLRMQNGAGRAYVQGEKWYRVDFHFSDGVLHDLFCDCPCANLCKHEVAVALTVWKLLQPPQLQESCDFTALDRDLFWHLAARTKAITL